MDDDWYDWDGVCWFGGDCHAFATFSNHLDAPVQGANGMYDLMVAGTVPMLKTTDGQFEAEFFQCPVDGGVLRGFATVHGFAIRNGDNVLQAVNYWDTDFDRDWITSFPNWVNPIDSWTPENYKTKILEDCPSHSTDCMLGFDFEYYAYGAWGSKMQDLSPARLSELFEVGDDMEGCGCSARDQQHAHEEEFWQAHLQTLESEGKTPPINPSRRGHYLYCNGVDTGYSMLSMPDVGTEICGFIYTINENREQVFSDPGGKNTCPRAVINKFLEGFGWMCTTFQLSLMALFAAVKIKMSTEKALIVLGWHRRQIR